MATGCLWNFYVLVCHLCGGLVPEEKLLAFAKTKTVKTEKFQSVARDLEALINPSTVENIELQRTAWESYFWLAGQIRPPWVPGLLL